MNAVGPYHNRQETYAYFSLPFCKGSIKEIGHYHETLGEALQGVELEYSGLKVGFKGTCTCTVCGSFNNRRLHVFIVSLFAQHTCYNVSSRMLFKHGVMKINEITREMHSCSCVTCNKKGIHVTNTSYGELHVTN